MELLQKLPIRRTMTRSSTAPGNSSPPASPEPAYESTPITSPRSLRQLSLFFVGAACFLASTAITRRAIYRRQLRIIPKFYEPNTNPHEHFSPLHDALQALNLATINCVSLGIMGVGGALWAADISGVEELRAVTRSRLGYELFDKSGYDNPDTAEESLEEAIIRKRKEGDGTNDTTFR